MYRSPKQRQLSYIYYVIHCGLFSVQKFGLSGGFLHVIPTIAIIFVPPFCEPFTTTFFLLHGSLFKPNCYNFYSNPVNFHFNSLYLVYLPQINSVFKLTFQREMEAVTDQKETRKAPKNHFI